MTASLVPAEMGWLKTPPSPASLQAVEQGELLGQQVLWHPPAKRRTSGLRPAPRKLPAGQLEEWGGGGGGRSEEGQRHAKAHRF